MLTLIQLHFKTTEKNTDNSNNLAVPVIVFWTKYIRVDCFIDLKSESCKLAYFWLKCDFMLWNVPNSFKSFNVIFNYNKICLFDKDI